MSDNNEQSSPQNMPAMKITPTSLMSYGNLRLVILRVDREGLPPGYYVSPRRLVTGDEDPMVFPVSQIPQLIKMLEKVVDGAITLQSLIVPGSVQLDVNTNTDATEK
jgi:hypothetical protein